MQQSSNKYLPAYAAVTTLFFAWGFITSLLDPLVAAVKGIFSLSDVEAQLSASAFFIAYGVMSFPAAKLLARCKSVPTILIALAVMIAGCLTMLLAVHIELYDVVLLGFFITACGITALQVAANPLAAALGSPEKTHFRLTFSQTFNSLGPVLGTSIGASLFLNGIETKEGTVITEAVRAEALAGMELAYFWLSGLIGLLFLFFFFTRKTVSQADYAHSPQVSNRSILSMLKEAFNDKWALLGGLGIFLYVGAEVAIGTQMSFFLNSDAIWGQSDAIFQFPLTSLFAVSDGVVGISLQEGAKLTTMYWSAALVGRLAGSVLLFKFNAAKLLTIFTAMTTLMCLYVFLVGGVSAGFIALSIGLFNSIMFPVIFSLTLERSNASTEATSGFLCTCIIGGAFIPPLVGLVSENSNYVTAFIVPAVCYAALCVFAWSAGKEKNTHKVADVTASH